MKKYLWMIAAIAIVAVGCKKDEPEPVDETPAQLVSFQILAADNEGLEADYAPEVISESMIIRVPGGGQGKTFVATLTAGENDVIKVNDEAVENGKASFDASYAVDIVVTNSKSNKSAQYEVKIGKILQITSKAAGKFISSGEMNYTSSSYEVAISPAGEIYLAYTFTPAEGVKNIGVVKYSEGQFAQVGAEGIIDAAEAVAATFCNFTFDKDGTPYVLYVGGDVSKTFSIRKFDGSSWKVVGPAGFASNPKTSGAAKIYFGASNNPGVLYMKSDRSTGVIYLDNNEWKEGAISELPPYVKTGGDRSSNQGCYWNSAYAYVGDKYYGVFSINRYGLYIYEFAANSWSKQLVADYIPTDEETALPGNLSLASKDGKMYVFTALWKAGSMQVYEFDGTALTPYGAPFKIGMSSSGTPDGARFGINPVTGEFFAVMVDAEKKVKYSTMNADKQWEDFVGFPDAPGSYGAMGLAFDKAGNAIVIYPEEGRKDGFHVYSIGLEDDVLPE
ncbi:MAG: hypothetical protein K6F21_08050 [Bacteroidales bacterium]|nr:hypothetical protein [Bacteroidales bacterium]